MARVELSGDRAPEEFGSPEHFTDVAMGVCGHDTSGAQKNARAVRFERMWSLYLGDRTVRGELTSSCCVFGYLPSMKPASQPLPVEPEKLKPVFHDKIERMDAKALGGRIAV